MGYYTQYDVSENSPEIIEALEEVSQYDLNCMDVGVSDTIKWYSCISDCITVSKAFPDTLIKVRGEGEESGDIWKAYFLNGKYQMCKAILTFEDFDENKLKENN